MRKRLKAFFKKLAQWAAGRPQEWDQLMSVFEISVAVLPFTMGALLLLDFRHRLWMVFFFLLGSAAFLAVGSIRLHRVRRKIIADQQRMIKDLLAERGDLLAERGQFGEFFNHLAAAADGRGEVQMKVHVHGPQPIRPESNPDKMN